jgi:hypothetical protein
MSQRFKKVTCVLNETFSMKHLHYSREDILNEHTPYLFQKLFPDVRGVIDGTYFYVQKSKNFDLQKRTYSSHKFRNLVKAMFIILPDGRIWDFAGLFFADGSHSDEFLWKYIIGENICDFSDCFQPEDQFLGDRGFSRIDFDEYELHCPTGLVQGNNQHTSTEANDSRKVTRLRNVVERAFGRLKQWKMLATVINNKHLPNLAKIIRILCTNILFF